MRIQVTLTLMMMMLTVSTFSQHVVVSADSTQLLFPNKVAIALNKDRKTDEFSISGKSLRVLLVQTNYVYERLALLSATLELSKKELQVCDSMVAVLKQANTVSGERVAVYSDAYTNTRFISEEYDKQIRSLMTEVARLQAATKRSKRKSFGRGVLAGIAVGAGTIILLGAMR